jgi:hypothetical protein
VRHVGEGEGKGTWHVGEGEGKGTWHVDEGESVRVRVGEGEAPAVVRVSRCTLGEGI